MENVKNYFFSGINLQKSTYLGLLLINFSNLHLSTWYHHGYIVQTFINFFHLNWLLHSISYFLQTIPLFRVKCVILHKISLFAVYDLLFHLFKLHISLGLFQSCSWGQHFQKNCIFKVLVLFQRELEVNTHFGHGIDPTSYLV